MHKLLLIRHGDAEYSSADGSDASRELSVKGRHDIGTQAEFLEAAGKDLTLICHSPFVRAVQTAQILASHLQLPLEMVRELRPSGRLELLENALLGLNQHAIFVSHLPIIADFAQAVTGQIVRFMPGTMVMINRNDPSRIGGRIHWVHHPSSDSGPVLG